MHYDTFIQKTINEMVNLLPSKINESEMLAFSYYLEIESGYNTTNFKEMLQDKKMRKLVT